MMPFSVYVWMTGGEPTAVLTVRLYSSRRNPLPLPPAVTDFTECTFAGYARITYPPAAQTVFLASATGILQFPALRWAWGPRGTQEVAQGALYVAQRQDGSEVVLGSDDFPTPQAMRQNGDAITCTFSVTAQPLTIIG